MPEEFASKPMTVVNFAQTCVDPLAKLVMMEAMEFAVQKAESRLESLGKIFTGLSDFTAMQDIKDIRFAVQSLPVCGVSINPAAPTGPPPSKEEVDKLDKREQDIVKSMPAGLQAGTLEVLAKGKLAAVETKTTVEKLEKAETKAAKNETIEAEKETKERHTAQSLGAVEYDGRTWTSLGEFLKELHGGTAPRGAVHYVKQADIDGYEVRVHDNKGKVIPANIKQTELDKLKPVTQKVGLYLVKKTGTVIAEPSVAQVMKKREVGTEPVGGKQKVGKWNEYPPPWTQMNDDRNKLLGFEDANGQPIPEASWRPLTSTQLSLLAPEIRKVAPIGATTIPIRGQGVSGVSGKTATAGSEE